MADDWEEGLYLALSDLAFTPRRQIAETETEGIAHRWRRSPPAPVVRRLIYRRRGSASATVAFFVLEENAAAPGGMGYVFVVHARHGAQDRLTDEEADDLTKRVSF